MAEAGENPMARTEPPIAEETCRLQMALGTTLVAAAAGTRDVQRVHEWAQQNDPDPSEAERQRILAARRSWRAIADAEGEQAARLWFVAANQRLGGDTPIDAIRGDRFRAAEAAAAAAVQGTWW